MRTQATAHEVEARGNTRRSALLLVLALGAALAALVALAGTARQAEATFPGTNGKIVFASERTTGTGVDNPTGDYEIFTSKPDGTGLKQLTNNTVNDSFPVFSPDGKKIAYESQGVQTSNLDGDYDVYLMNATDGSGQTNLSNNGYYVHDFDPVFSPDGKKIAYESQGVQTSNPEGDYEIYLMSATDGSGQTNLSNNGTGVTDLDPVFSPGGEKVSYWSRGIQTSNPEGEAEVYVLNSLDGTGKKNLTNNGVGVEDFEPVFSPGGQKIAYESRGVQTSNPQGDFEIYIMNALDGTSKKNLSNNGSAVHDETPVFSHDGAKVAYDSEGIQTSNPQGDIEVYVMNALDGTGKKNLTNNGGTADDYYPIFSPDGRKIAYTSEGKQTSNPEGDMEVYVMSTLDGSAKKNLSNNGEYDEGPDWGRQAM